MIRMKSSRVVYVSFVIFCVCSAGASLAAESKPKSESVTAILGAFEREVTLIEGQVTQRRDRKIEGIRFVSGKLNGQRVVVCRSEGNDDAQSSTLGRDGGAAQRGALVDSQPGAA